MIKKGLKLLGDTFEVVTLKKVIVCPLLGLFCQLLFFRGFGSEVRQMS
jgi:hypothetical protein